MCKFYRLQYACGHTGEPVARMGSCDKYTPNAACNVNKKYASVQETMSLCRSCNAVGRVVTRQYMPGRTSTTQQLPPSRKKRPSEEEPYQTFDPYVTSMSKRYTSEDLNSFQPSKRSRSSYDEYTYASNAPQMIGRVGNVISPEAPRLSGRMGDIAAELSVMPATDPHVYTARKNLSVNRKRTSDQTRGNRTGPRPQPLNLVSEDEAMELNDNLGPLVSPEATFDPYRGRTSPVSPMSRRGTFRSTRNPNPSPKYMFNGPSISPRRISPRQPPTTRARHAAIVHAAQQAEYEEAFHREADYNYNYNNPELAYHQQIQSNARALELGYPPSLGPASNYRDLYNHAERVLQSGRITLAQIRSNAEFNQLSGPDQQRLLDDYAPTLVAADQRRNASEAQAFQGARARHGRSKPQPQPPSKRRNIFGVVKGWFGN